MQGVLLANCQTRWQHSTATCEQSNQKICSKQVFIPAWELQTNMKIANVHVGTLHQNVRIGNWALQFSYQNAIFISVCNFHISLQFSRFCVLFLRGRLQFSYQFAIFIWVCNFHISLQFSRHDSSTYVCGFAWSLVWSAIHPIVWPAQ